MKAKTLPIASPTTKHEHSEAIAHLRFGMEPKDITDIAKNVEFRVFRWSRTKDGALRDQRQKHADKFSRKISTLITGPPQFGPRGSWFKSTTTQIDRLG